MKKRILTIILSALLLGTSLLGLSFTSAVSAAVIDQPKPIEDIFPDSALADNIAVTLGKVPTDIVTQSDLDGITQVVAISAGIESIEGVEYLNSLSFLALLGNQIEDISPVAGLISLTYLNFSNNQISDVSSLAGLTNLTSLSLLNNNISNIDSLAGLTHLTFLDIGRNIISNISSLEGMSSMISLYIHDNQISDLTPLTGLNSIQVLEISNNPISNIEPLATLTNLQFLAMISNAVRDVSPLSNLPLQTIKAEDNQITDLSSLGTMFATYTFLGTLNSQNAVLEPIAITATSGTVTITNNVYDPSGNPVPINDGDISDGGTYDAATNTITWTNVTTDTDLTYSFSTPITLLGMTSTFSGIVTQPVTIGYGYQVQYYQYSTDLGNLIVTDIVDVPYPAGHQLTETDVNADLGSTWLNAHQPDNFQSGIASYPIISANAADNIVVVVYTPNPAPVNPGGTKKLILPKTGATILPFTVGFAVLGTLSVVKGLKKSK